MLVAEKKVTILSRDGKKEIGVEHSVKKARLFIRGYRAS